MFRPLATVGLAAGIVLGTPVWAQGILRARLAEPTGRYGHHPMGPGVADQGALVVTLDDGRERRFRLPVSRVFEDNAARVVDLDADGQAEVVVVESDLQRGARLSVYGPEGLRAASPFIGQRNRWMAVAAITDLDGDGRLEVAVVDRPHLRRVLVIWQMSGAALVPVAAAPGVTNHRLGAAEMIGGPRDCGAGPDIILARADWTGLVSAQMQDGALVLRDLGPGTSPSRLARVMTCAE